VLSASPLRGSGHGPNLKQPFRFPAPPPPGARHVHPLGDRRVRRACSRHPPAPPPRLGHGFCGLVRVLRRGHQLDLRAGPSARWFRWRWRAANADAAWAPESRGRRAAARVAGPLGAPGRY